MGKFEINWKWVYCGIAALVIVVAVVFGIRFFFTPEEDPGENGGPDTEDIVALPSENGKVYALLLDDTKLVFTKLENGVEEDDMYDSPKWGECLVTAVYTEFESTVFENEEDVPWYDVREDIVEVATDAVFAPTAMAYWFSGFENCTVMEIDKIDVFDVTTMRSLFMYCSSLSGLKIQNWNVSNVTDMSNMFRGCSNFLYFDATEWNVASVTDMSGMFSECTSLEALEVLEWDTSSVTTMNAMFENCKKLTQLDIQNWDTSSVTDMSMIFSGCISLELDVSDWNIINVAAHESFNDNAPGVINPFEKNNS